jgi:hypothetical protein
MPTRKTLKCLAIAVTNNARPYTTDTVRSKIFHRPGPVREFPANDASGNDDIRQYRIGLIETVEEAGYWCAGN